MINCVWLPNEIPKHCKFIISTNANLRDPKDIIIESATDCLENKEDKQRVIEGMLAAHCKKFDRGQMNKVVNAELSHLPLYLSIIATELRIVAKYRYVFIFLSVLTHQIFKYKYSVVSETNTYTFQNRSVPPEKSQKCSTALY